MPGTFAALATTAIASTLLANLGLLPPALAAGLLLATCGRLLAELIVQPASSADRRLRGEVVAWKEALVNDRSAQLSHDLVHWPRRIMRDAALFLRTAGYTREATRVERAGERCQAAGRRGGRRTGDFGDPSGGRLGLIGGAALTTPTRSDRPLRHFSVAANLPRWLGPAWAERLSRLMRPIDLVRLLHTPQIERRTLVGTLWLRAAIVLAAPLSGAVSPSGDVPLGSGSTAPAEALYWLVACEAVATAILAPRIADFVIGRPVRWPLLLAEQALALALIGAFPCWACCAYAAGPIVWFEKREWSLWKIPVWAVLNLGAVLAFASQSPVAEAAIAAVVVALIADSYGLMLPAVLATLLRGWHAERTARKLIVARAARSRETVRGAIAETRVVLERAGEDDGAPDGGEIETLLDGLAQAEEQLERTAASDLGRPPHTLADICAQAVAGAGVSPAGWDPGAALHATQIECRPEDLGRLEVTSPGARRALERLVKRVVFEAVAHGLGLLSTRIEAAGDRVVVAIANEVHPDRIDGAGAGYRWTEALAASLPGATVDPGLVEEFNGLTMWVVRVQLEVTCFKARR